MPQIQFPHTMKRGTFAGRTFTTSTDYQRALRELARKKRKAKVVKLPTAVIDAAEFEFTAKHCHTVIVLKGNLDEAAPELVSVINSMAKPSWTGKERRKTSKVTPIHQPA